MKTVKQYATNSRRIGRARDVSVAMPERIASAQLTQTRSLHLESHAYPRKSWTSFANSGVVSTGSMWPTVGSVTSFEFAIFDWKSGP